MTKFTNANGLVDETPCPGCGWPRSSCLCPADDLMLEPQWICLNCKTVIGPIVDDDDNQCACDVYDMELVRVVEDKPGSYRVVDSYGCECPTCQAIREIQAGGG